MKQTPSSWIDQFLGYLRLEKSSSPHTISNYRRDIVDFLSYCQAQSVDDWAAVRASHLRQYSAHCHRNKLAGRSIQRRLSALSSFFQYLIREGQLDANPVAPVSAPKSGKRLPSVLDIDQMERLLRIEGDDVLSVRDLAIMELFYSSGLRLSELTGLDLGDVDLNDAMVRVTGKGNKTRIVPIGRHARTALRQWLDSRAQLVVDDTQALFLSQRGGRLSQRSIQLRLREWAIKQGLDEQLHPHRLRHSFASHLLESSGDIRAVQELLGHANLSTTQIYTHLDFQHLAKVYDQAHPRARKKK
ncbi:MAG: tyrosine recombinase XerC [Gammaproteobacteria bacterium]|nr:tyrosine recombinase XerC [Gammaproteobacteria bacterium]